MLFSPLEQFDVIYLGSILGNQSNSIFNIDIANIVVFMALTIVLVLLISVFFLEKIFFVSFLQKSFEQIYFVILDMVYQQSGETGLKYFSYFFAIFFFILFSNLLGMLPYGFTVTAHLSVTFFLALVFNLGFIFLGFYLHRIDFLKLFVPSGTPKMLLPLIVVIEVVSYLIRTFSLSIRLFANMMAGHCLLYVISSFVFGIMNSFGIVSIIPLSFVYIAVFILEFAIAFLQAYVFTILLCIYLNDSLHPGH